MRSSSKMKAVFDIGATDEKARIIYALCKDSANLTSFSIYYSISPGDWPAASGCSVNASRLCDVMCASYGSRKWNGM